MSVSALSYIDKSWLVYKRLVLSPGMTANETWKKFSVMVFALSPLQLGYVFGRTGLSVLIATTKCHSGFGA